MLILHHRGHGDYEDPGATDNTDDHGADEAATTSFLAVFVFSAVDTMTVT